MYACVCKLSFSFVVIAHFNDQFQKAVQRVFLNKL